MNKISSYIIKLSEKLSEKYAQQLQTYHIISEQTGQQLGTVESLINDYQQAANQAAAKFFGIPQATRIAGGKQSGLFLAGKNRFYLE